MRHDVGLLTLRLVTGGLLAGHGSQKLFGAFNGPGPEGTGKMMEHLNLSPGKQWGMAAGLSECAGGALTALGLGGPLGQIGILSAMSMAGMTVHWGKPIWVTEGGAELPLTNGAVALALIVMGPGRISLDRALGIRVPPWLSVGVGLGAASTIAAGLSLRSQPSMKEAESAEQGQGTDQRATA